MVNADALDATYPVISVVQTDGETTVVWHVHTGPDDVTGRLNGGWVLGAGAPDLTEDLSANVLINEEELDSGDNDLNATSDELDAQVAAATVDTRTDREKIKGLIRGTYVVITDDSCCDDIPGVDKVLRVLTLPDIAGVIGDEVKEIRRFSKELQAQSPAKKLVTPAFPSVPLNQMKY